MKSNGAAHGGHYVRISDHLTATPATESDRYNIIEPKRTKRLGEGVGNIYDQA